MRRCRCTLIPLISEIIYRKRGFRYAFRMDAEQCFIILGSRNIPLDESPPRLVFSYLDPFRRYFSGDYDWNIHVFYESGASFDQEVSVSGISKKHK